MYRTRVAELLLDLCLIPVAYKALPLRSGEANAVLNYPFSFSPLPIVLACS